MEGNSPLRVPGDSSCPGLLRHLPKPEDVLRTDPAATEAISPGCCHHLLRHLGGAPGSGHGGGDGARQRAHFPGAPQGGRGPAEAAAEGGRVGGAGLRLPGHHADPAQPGGQSAPDRLLRGAVDPHVLHDRRRWLQYHGQGQALAVPAPGGQPAPAAAAAGHHRGVPGGPGGSRRSGSPAVRVPRWAPGPRAVPGVCPAPHPGHCQAREEQAAGGSAAPGADDRLRQRRALRAGGAGAGWLRGNRAGLDHPAPGSSRADGSSCYPPREPGSLCPVCTQGKGESGQELATLASNPSTNTISLWGKACPLPQFAQMHSGASAQLPGAWGRGVRVTQASGAEPKRRGSLCPGVWHLPPWP
ncbi:uroporphyrinogen decarboxylase isoform 3-T3 [Pangshura tecta]